MTNEKYENAVFVKDGLSVTSMLTSEENDNEIITVSLGDSAVTNVYKPPNMTYAFPSGMTALNAHLWVVIGNLNSHSSIWDYSQTDRDGELVN